MPLYCVLLLTFVIHKLLSMVEIDDAEFMLIADFINAVELDENSPEDLIKKYTDALQVVNAFGPAQQAAPDPAMAAPA